MYYLPFGSLRLENKIVHRQTNRPSQIRILLVFLQKDEQMLLVQVPVLKRKIPFDFVKHAIREYEMSGSSTIYRDLINCHITYLGKTFNKLFDFI